MLGNSNLAFLLNRGKSMVAKKNLQVIFADIALSH